MSSGSSVVSGRSALRRRNILGLWFWSTVGFVCRLFASRHSPEIISVISPSPSLRGISRPLAPSHAHTLTQKAISTKSLAEGYYDGTLMQLERAQKDGILHVPYTSFLDVVKTAEEAIEVCARRCRGVGESREEDATDAESKVVAAVEAAATKEV